MYLVGIGLDQHILIKKNNSSIILGGYKFKSNYTIKAVSDGDVVIHSICNAILGAIQKGDIGEYFKDTDCKNKGLSSKLILSKCLKMLGKKKIVNIDLTIQCENIIFNEIKNEIKKSLITLTKCKLVNVKATRFEHPSNLIVCQSIVGVN